MGSLSRDVRERQKARTVNDLEARVAALTAKGLDKKAVDRDATVRELRASVRKTDHRIEAIDALDAQNKQRAEEKVAKAAAPRVSKKKAAKKADAAASAGKSKKKPKKDKKEKKS